MTTAEVRVPATVPCGGGTLAIDGSGQITLLADGQPDVHAELEGVRRGDYVELWCGGTGDASSAKTAGSCGASGPRRGDLNA
jgi:hypothetical protein